MLCPSAVAYVVVDSNMCTQDVRQYTMCGCQIKAGGVKDCGKKGTPDCKGIRDNVIAWFSGWCTDHPP